MSMVAAPGRRHFERMWSCATRPTDGMSSSWQVTAGRYVDLITVLAACCPQDCRDISVAQANVPDASDAKSAYNFSKL